MPVKIRLQRRGKKGQPFYHLVIADGRAPRDGKFIEKLGTYNPLTHPATIEVDFDRAYYWVMCGAKPTDVARMILKREGIYMKKHLMGGVQKGAFTEEQAEEKLTAWKEEKSQKLNDVKLDVINSARSANKKRLDAETKVKQAKEAILAEKRSAELAAEAAKNAEAKAKAEMAVAEETVEETAETAEVAVSEEPVSEIPVAEEVPVSEEIPAVEEVPVAEEIPVVEETPVVAEVSAVEEVPAVEEVSATEETPAAE